MNRIIIKRIFKASCRAWDIVLSLTMGLLPEYSWARGPSPAFTRTRQAKASLLQNNLTFYTCNIHFCICCMRTKRSISHTLEVTAYLATSNDCPQAPIMALCTCRCFHRHLHCGYDCRRPTTRERHNSDRKCFLAWYRRNLGLKRNRVAHCS